MNLHEKIDRDYEPLIPLFMKNQKEVILELERAVKASDFNQLKFLTHRLEGTSENYGFLQLGEYSNDLGKMAYMSDTSQMKTLIEKMKLYLEQVEITYIEL